MRLYRFPPGVYYAFLRDSQAHPGALHGLELPSADPGEASGRERRKALRGIILGDGPGLRPVDCGCGIDLYNYDILQKNVGSILIT